MNKRTLAVLLGATSRGSNICCWSAGRISRWCVVLVNALPPTALLAFLTAREAQTLMQIFNTQTDPAALHPAQGRTASCTASSVC